MSCKAKNISILPINFLKCRVKLAPVMGLLKCKGNLLYKKIVISVFFLHRSKLLTIVFNLEKVPKHEKIVAGSNWPPLCPLIR